MTMLFSGDVDFFEKFYLKCIEQDLTTEEDRVNLLIKMSMESKDCSIYQTSRTKEQVIKDYTQHYDDILVVEPDKEVK